MDCWADIFASASARLASASLSAAALLGEFGVFFQAQYLQRFLRRVEVLLGDGDFGVAYRLVALLAFGLDDLRQRRQAFGVKGIVGVEELGVGLVELGERGAFQFEAVELEIGGDGGLHRLDEIGTLLLEVCERHRGGDGAQRIDEFRFHQFAQLGHIVGAFAQRLRRKRDRGRIRLDANIELDPDVDPHAVLGDHGVLGIAVHVEAKRLQIDPGNALEDRQDHRAAVDHHLLAAESGSDICAVLLGAVIEPPDDHPDDHDGHENERGRNAELQKHIHDGDSSNVTTAGWVAIAPGHKPEGEAGLKIAATPARTRGGPRPR
jgi:hypothetical protein